MTFMLRERVNGRLVLIPTPFIQSFFSLTQNPFFLNKVFKLNGKHAKGLCIFHTFFSTTLLLKLFYACMKLPLCLVTRTKVCKKNYRAREWRKWRREQSGILCISSSFSYLCCLGKI